MFEQAKWITSRDHRSWRHPPHDHPYPAPYLVRDFTVGSGLLSASLAVAGLGQAAYYLNGERLAEAIHPTHRTSHTRSIVYTTYDITTYLGIGENRFGAIVGHIDLCEPDHPYRMSTPRMIAEITLTYEDGHSESIVSDSSFLAADSHILFSLRRCGEWHDATCRIPDWCMPGVAGEAFHPAVLCASPGGALRPTACPPKRVSAEIPGVPIAPGVYDFGEHLSGWVELTLHTPEHDRCDIVYSEWLTDDGLHVTHEGLQKGSYPPMLHRDVYIPAGEAGERFEPLFSYHGFRYVEVTGAVGEISLVAKRVHTDLTPLASFRSSDATLTAIHEACHRSILACAQGAMLDCPQREQNEWTGDGMLTAEVIAMTYDAYDFYYEWMMKFRDDQLPSGQLPAIIPCRSNWPHSFANGLDWSSAIVHIPYYVYRFSGDLGIVDLMWEPMVRAMDYFASRSACGLVDFGVGDWVSLEPPCPIEITDTVYYRLDALMMAELAEATGRDAAPWRALAEGIKRAFREKYVKDGRLTDRRLTPLVGAVYSGMLEEAEIPSHVAAAADILVRDGYAIRAGVHGLRMLFDVLSSNGYASLVLRVLQNPAAPGYAKAVADGLTTLPEEFDYRTKNHDTGKYPSLNHQFTAMVDTWFFRYLAGIDLGGAGRLRIAPLLLDEISSFSATLRGVSVEWENGFLTVTSPLAFTLSLGGREVAYPAGTYRLSLGRGSGV